MEIFELTAHELSDLLQRGKLSAEEIVCSVFERIGRVEGDLKAYVTLTEEDALAAARSIDARRKKGEELGPLAGIPVGLKDNICTKGVRTTCSSLMLENFVPPYDATVVEKLKQSGAVVTGKLNMDEFAMGSSTEFSAFFPTHNPWDMSRVPGGSSGGAAAATAAGEAVFALGSDTGGSVRQPASFCGVVGMKPTYGLVSRYGVVAFASSMDQVGTITRDVRDCALVLNLIAGHDPLDSTSVSAAVPDYTSFLTDDLKGKRIGVLEEMFGEGIDPAVADVVKAAVKKLEELGAVVEPCSFPHASFAPPVYYIIAQAEASSNLARFDGIRYGYRAQVDAAKGDPLLDLYMKTRGEGFGPEVKRRVMLGTHLLSSDCYDPYYLKAARVRTVIRGDYKRLFQDFDLLVSPTTPQLPFKLGEGLDDPLVMCFSDMYTVSVNLAGLPAVSLPCGFVDGLPVGMQLIAPAFKEGDLLQAAYAFEQNTPYHQKRPPLTGAAAEGSDS